jgi:hypothetical protein
VTAKLTAAEQNDSAPKAAGARRGQPGEITGKFLGRGILSSQCLDRRIPDKQTLIDEIAAWEHDRNANHTKANWQFTAPNARIKLKHLYTSI